ncbi:MAG: hypothetical protein M3426_01070 [Actinomycetota bacterium]|nr:hypothetical protein [Actinomycetota bacterium]
MSSEGYRDSKAAGEYRTFGMTKSRVFLLSAVSFLLVIGSLFSIVFDEEFWPFSPYPMYAKVQREPSVSELQLYGVTQEAPHREVSMRNSLRDSAYIEPFDQGRLRMALRKMESKPNPEKRSQLLNEALLDSMKRYEKLRLAGLHDGPPLQGMRLYRTERQLNAQTENADQADHRELIAEVEQG